MEDIYALLNINKGVLQDFPLQAERLVDHQTELAINRTVRTLKDIEEHMMSDKAVNVSQQSIDEIMQKVIDNAKENNTDDTIWSIRELRIVSYYLIKLQGNEGAYEYALGLLERNWRDLFFNGLSFYCLDQWNMIDPPLRIKTCELLRNKLQQYNDGNKKYMAMKNHSNLFDEVGTKRLSALLSQKKEDVKNAPMYFNNKPSTLNQSYYSDVIVNFCESNRIMDIDYIDSIFEIHNLDRTKKLVIADLVSRVNDRGGDMERTNVCKFANRILGDITLVASWAPFSGATEKDAQKLKKAKQLVNLWLNKKIIETFFEICAQDRDRKLFWLRYLDSKPLDGFQIVGSTATKRLLQSDTRVNGMFQRYFIETDSYSAQTSALILFIKNKMLVEFSDTGALYVYDQNHRMVNLVTKKKNQISKTSDLKITSMSNLIQINDWGGTYYYEEGRMAHIGYWQDRLNGWLNQMVLSSTNTNVSFIHSKDEDVFKAKPVEKEEFKPTAKPIKQRTLFDDVPEYEVKPKVKSSTTKPISQSKPNSTSVPTKAVYEDNIRFEITSKWFFNDKCKVVANSKGYYVNIYRGRKYIFVRNLTPGTRVSGTNIWIKRPNPNGWTPIVHALSGREIAVGFIKEAGGGLMFKQNLSLTDFMKIDLY